MFDNYLKIVLLTFAIIFSLLIGYISYTPDRTVHVYDSPGGVIWDFMNDYRKLEAEGYNLEIHGVCASACTSFYKMFSEDKVCAHDNALFGFHGVSGGFSGYNRPMTEFYFEQVYTEELIQKIMDRGFSYATNVDFKENPTGMIWMTAEEIGVRSCDGTYPIPEYVEENGVVEPIFE